MMDIARQALGHWGFEGASLRLVAARENAVFELVSGGTHAALRLHRKGYRSNAQLISELAWMAMVAQAGISVPAPIPARDGKMLHHVNGVQVDVLTWLPGATMEDALEALPPEDQTRVFRTLGQDMARLHMACDAWAPLAGFDRVHWDLNGLLGDAPLWDRFWDNPALCGAEKTLFAEFRDRAAQDLELRAPGLDYGLIHADLVPANVLVDGARLRFIDFDDGGFGFRLFDVATALVKHRASQNFARFQSALIAGYHSVRPLDTGALTLFMALRAATYVGWNITRMNEPDGAARNARLIAAARECATQYLDAEG